MSKVGAGAARLFGCVAGQLDAVNGRHLASDQTLPVAQVERLGKDASKVVGQRRDKSGERSEARLAVATQGNEGDVVAAGGFNVTAGNNALAVGKQNDLEEHGGRKGGRAGSIIPEPSIEMGEIKLVVNEVIESVLKGAGKELPGQRQ